MRVAIEVQSTHRYTADIGQLSPGLIAELIRQDGERGGDGYFVGQTDWSIQEMSTEGETTIDKVLVEELKGVKK